MLAKHRLGAGWPHGYNAAFYGRSNPPGAGLRMDQLHIRGGTPLRGSVRAAGSKNATLPIMAAALLCDEPVGLQNVPELGDVRTLSAVLRCLGAAVERDPNGRLQIETIDPQRSVAPRRLVKRMRASFCTLGPLVARRGRAAVALPGGCRIGARPIDLHLRGLAALGADLQIRRGYVVASARRLRGATVDLAGPHGPTVTGTANVLSAAVLARGTTRIIHAAREPEIVDLGRFLNSLGARISGLGTSIIRVEGVERLAGGDYRVMADRIEAATLLVAAAIAGGDVTVLGVEADQLAAVLEKLAEAGALVSAGPKTLRVQADGRPRPYELSTAAYPGIPTDLQAPLMALACLARGRSSIRDRVFPERFEHITQFRRMGADITRSADRAFVCGGRLFGAAVAASDLRAAAALVLAGLAARGETVVRGLAHLDRGYQQLEDKLLLLGARVERRQHYGFCTTRPDSVTSSQSPMSSNEPMPTSPCVNVVSRASMAGFLVSSK